MKVPPIREIVNYTKFVTLAILAVLSLWIEVGVGVQLAWDSLVGYVASNSPDVIPGVVLIFLSIAGPISLVFWTWKTHKLDVNVIERGSIIFGRVLLVTGPIAIVGLLLVLLMSLGSFV